jgi:hypothetical protein
MFGAELQHALDEFDVLFKTILIKEHFSIRKWMLPPSRQVPIGYNNGQVERLHAWKAHFGIIRKVYHTLYI